MSISLKKTDTKGLFTVSGISDQRIARNLSKEAREKAEAKARAKRQQQVNRFNKLDEVVKAADRDGTVWVAVSDEAEGAIPKIKRENAGKRPSLTSDVFAELLSEAK